MRTPRPTARLAAVPAAVGLAAALTMAAAPGLATAATRTSASPGSLTTSKPSAPTIKLTAAQKDITVFSFRHRVFLDPGIWLSSENAQLVFHVQRASYTTPVQLSQVFSDKSVTVEKFLPSDLLDGWNGLAHFFHLTLKNSAGKTVVSSRLPFCPNSFDPGKVSPSAPTASPFPQQCAALDPFQKAMVWGVQKGWAVDPAETAFSRSMELTLPDGTYHATEKITNKYLRLLGIPRSDAAANVTVHVKKEPKCCGAQHAGQTPKPLSKDPAAPTMNNPPTSALPDLVPLPSWGIQVSHVKKQKTDLLNFGATVWVGGNSRLDVQGFRSNGSPIMKAYQYFWHNGQLIGRTRAGTMGFDTKKGHNHWHFEQFAAYRLLNSSKSLVLRSHKQGFCIAPTDPVDLLLHNTTWKPSDIGFGGQCGVPTALWVREQMPIGWGDTYFQSVAGQSFDITHVPNGTYYIQILANPQKVLHETHMGNDVSLRKVILGGTPGHRTVKVPAWHGIDPEK
jgi:hypothetical protein